MKVFIVVKDTEINNIGELVCAAYIESVWSTQELAKAAIQFHSFNSKIDYNKYSVVEREINVALKLQQ